MIIILIIGFILMLGLSVASFLWVNSFIGIFLGIITLGSGGYIFTRPFYLRQLIAVVRRPIQAHVFDYSGGSFVYFKDKMIQVRRKGKAKVDYLVGKGEKFPQIDRQNVLPTTGGKVVFLVRYGRNKYVSFKPEIASFEDATGTVIQENVLPDILANFEAVKAYDLQDNQETEEILKKTSQLEKLLPVILLAVFGVIMVMGLYAAFDNISKMLPVVKTLTAALDASAKANSQLAQAYAGGSPLSPP